MTGLNHGLTGGLIALTVNPVVALPLALVSHFILDIVPHYGIDQKERDKSMFWKIFSTLDVLMIAGLAVFTVVSGYFGDFTPLIVACAFLATSPDYYWVIEVIKNRSFKLDKHRNRFMKWHAKIQKYEFKKGIYIELCYTLFLLWLIFFVLT